jgi:hypothetical protein
MKADTDARPSQTTPDRPSEVRSDALLADAIVADLFTDGGGKEYAR